MRGRLAIAAGVGLLAALPAPGVASEVHVEIPGKGNSFVVFTAEPGERNRLSVASTGVDTVRVTDQGNSLLAGFGCESVNANQATCDVTPPPRAFQVLIEVEAELGGKRDRAEAGSGVRWRSLDGGPGRDRLLGSAFFDFLDGGRGADKVFGRGSDDTVSYTDRPDDLRVTLGDRKRNEGGRRDGRKRDLLKGIEDVGGGEGDDLLVGNARENRLVGEGGNDKLRGRGATDHLFGFDGRDTLRGGGGGDDLQDMDGNDRVFGQGGDDTVAAGTPNGADLIVGGGQAGDRIMYTSEARIQMDGRANDGKCADPSCATSEERDNLKGLRTLSTFFGNDLIIGSNVSETIGPGPGADRVRALGGNDTINLGADASAIDDVDCGTGTDTVIGAQPEDLLVNCE